MVLSGTRSSDFVNALLDGESLEGHSCVYFSTAVRTLTADRLIRLAQIIKRQPKSKCLAAVDWDMGLLINTRFDIAYPKTVNDMYTVMRLNGTPGAMPYEYYGMVMLALARRPQSISKEWVSWLRTVVPRVHLEGKEWLLRRVFGESDYRTRFTEGTDDWESVVRDIIKILQFPVWMVSLKVVASIELLRRVKVAVAEEYARNLKRTGYEMEDHEPFVDVCEWMENKLGEVLARMDVLDPIMAIALQRDDSGWMLELFSLTDCRPRSFPSDMRSMAAYTAEYHRCFGGVEILRLRYPDHWARVSGAIDAPMFSVSIGGAEELVARAGCRPPMEDRDTTSLDVLMGGLEASVR